MTNEFEDMYNKDDFNENDAKIDTAEQPVSNNERPPQDEDMIAGGSRGQVYDINKAPDTAKGPERVDMDGQETIVTKMELIIPPADTVWKLSKSGKVKYKSCIFAIYYGNEGQKEYYSGVKVFQRMVNGVERYSDPAIQNTGTTQASQLKKTYAEYKGKKVEEVSLKEFLSFLSSQPKALLKGTDFEYYDDKTNQKTVTTKNIITKFI